MRATDDVTLWATQLEVGRWRVHVRRFGCDGFDLEGRSRGEAIEKARKFVEQFMTVGEE